MSTISLQPSGFEPLGSFVNASDYLRCAVITSEPMASLYGSQILTQLKDATLISLPITEESKTLSTLEKCWFAMKQAGLDRRSLVIALGGGTITDLVGFAAATYMRGMNYVNIPTTLLGMVDAGLGGKTGVNLGPHKNFIGAIHQPQHTFINLECLKSLPPRDLRSGLAEIFKAGVIWDVSFFEHTERSLDAIMALKTSVLVPIIQRACEIKMEIVGQDFNDLGLRALLNYGHTFAHALEGLTHYQRFLHGEAVAIGMVCAARVSVNLGLTQKETLQRIEAICQLAGLPTSLPRDIDPRQLVDLMRSDKKAEGGSITLLLPRAIGTVDKFTSIPEYVILESLSQKVCSG